MVEVFAALSRKGSQEVAEHSLVIVPLALMAVILTLGRTRVGGGGGVGGGFYEFFQRHQTFSVAVCLSLVHILSQVQ